MDWALVRVQIKIIFPVPKKGEVEKFLTVLGTFVTGKS